MSTLAPLSDTLHRQIEYFLIKEVHLLDERRFEEWLQIFAHDVHYWMPIRTVRGRANNQED